MNKQQSTQMASLRKKLIAAIAMLLVACIMTVSSTYAWFTLSTAPEVKGISTNIGANGNLEMALGTYDTFFGDPDPSAYVGSSNAATNDWTLTNITWGNLVDLSDASYGLDKITLYPSRLNANGNTINRTSPLMFPKYGADGRIIELSANTLVGSYDSNTNGFTAPATNENPATGVSGIGATSSMSKRAFAVMNAKSAMVTYKEAAKNAAKDAIREYAGTLASIALKYQNDAGTGVVSAADVAVLKNLIAKLQESNKNISLSMKSAILLALAAEPQLDEAAWTAAVALNTGDEQDVVAFIAALNGVANFTVPAAVNDLIASYEEIGETLSTALGVLPEGDTTWSVIKNSVSALLVVDGIEIGGYTIQEVKDAYTGTDEDGVIESLFQAMQNKRLAITFTSGIFADIAAMTGSYTSSMTFPKGTEVEGLDLNMFGAMTVNVNSDVDKLGAMATALDGKTAPEATGNTASPLTDTFGYMVDLLFRTNATESDLLLQTEGVGRIYGEKDIEKGNGSNMTFTINAEYSKEKIEGLAEGIRVVFFETTTTNDIMTSTILAVAALDVDNAVANGDAYKMNLKLTNYEIAANGVITLDDVTPFKADDDNALCALQANEKKAISALVYLDGDVIDNADAGTYNGLDAMLNLQFASSAELKPMVDSDLKGE